MVVNELVWMTGSADGPSHYVCHINGLMLLVFKNTSYNADDKSITFKAWYKAKPIYEDVSDVSLEETKEIVEEWYSIYKQLEEN